MPELEREQVERYLTRLYRTSVSVSTMTVLGGASGDIKSYGYGTPVKIEYRTSRGEQHTAVIHTMSPGRFGHEHMADRAQEMVWAHRAFNQLPRHVRSLDVCGFEHCGGLLSAGGVEEFGLLTEYVTGESYSHDLERLRDGAEPNQLDLDRADALCDYLAGIHRVRGSDPGLYVRRIRELVGHGECIMGIADSYPDASARWLEDIEHLAVGWRWRLKGLTHRLRQVHGDFHPWNILFRSGVDFSLLDRSRGEFGDPSDDVTSITLNYLFFSLQRSGRLKGAFECLFRRFWDRYLQSTGDSEMLNIAPPFLAFRGLVMASPVWYPALAENVRHKMLRFIRAVLESSRFDPSEANRYCEA